MRVLVTAGPTREYLDAVRFISNASSGRMGFACAIAAAKVGHDVTLVTGPVDLPDPRGMRVIRVTSAAEMYQVVLKRFPLIDAAIMTAAVGDYRPAVRFRGKLKKSSRTLSIKLVRTHDILAKLGRQKRGRILVGFALELQDAVHQALVKYKKKNLDYIILNTPRTFGADRMDCRIYREGVVVKRFRKAKKESVARWIVAAIAARPSRRRSPTAG